MERLVEALRPNDAREVVRTVGGILIALAMVLVAIRRGTPDVFGEGTSNFGLFVIFALPAAFLYGAGVLGRTLGGFDRRWQALYTVIGALLIPLALTQLVRAFDSSYDESLWSIFIFGLSAAACVAAWLIANVRFQLLLGGIFASIAWIAFLDKILGDNPSVTTVRWLILLFAAVLVAAAYFARQRATIEREQAGGELLTAAGLTAFVAYLLGPALGLEVASTTASISSTLGPGAIEPLGGIDPQQDMYWDLLTLLTGIVLVILGLGRGVRGPVYVGGAMLGLFALSAGLDLDDSTPQGKLLGWPLILGLLGAAGFIASLVPGERIPPAVGLGRWFHGGRDDAVEDAAAPTWQQPPAQAEPAAAAEVPAAPSEPAAPAAGEAPAPPAAEEPTQQAPAPPASEEPTQQQPPGEEPPRT